MTNEAKALTKRTAVSAYRAQRRGGKGVKGMITREGATEEDYIGALIPLRYEPRDLAIMQYADEEIKKVVLMLQEIGERPFEDTSEFVMREGILYRRNYRPGRQHLLVVPSCMRQDLIREYHDMPYQNVSLSN